MVDIYFETCEAQIFVKDIKKRVPALHFTLTHPAKENIGHFSTMEMLALYVYVFLPKNCTRILHVHILQEAITVILIEH